MSPNLEQLTLMVREKMREYERQALVHAVLKGRPRARLRDRLALVLRRTAERLESGSERHKRPVLG